MKKQQRKVTVQEIESAVRIIRILDWLMIKEIVSFYNRNNAVKITMTLSGYKHCLRNVEKIIPAATAAEDNKIHDFIPAFENLFQS